MRLTNNKYIDASICRKFIADILRRLGTEASTAERWAELLVETSLLGFDTHGIRMLDRYLKHIQAGGIDLGAEPRITDDVGSCVRMDGQAGLGHIAADGATRIAVERAEEHGISCVTLRNCNHVGACGIYARQAAAGLHRHLLGGEQGGHSSLGRKTGNAGFERGCHSGSYCGKS